MLGIASIIYFETKLWGAVFEYFVSKPEPKWISIQRAGLNNFYLADSDSTTQTKLACKNISHLKLAKFTYTDYLGKNEGEMRRPRQIWRKSIFLLIKSVSAESEFQYENCPFWNFSVFVRWTMGHCLPHPWIINHGSYAMNHGPDHELYSARRMRRLIIFSSNEEIASRPL